jgi:hypothetical protein
LLGNSSPVSGLITLARSKNFSATHHFPDIQGQHAPPAYFLLTV